MQNEGAYPRSDEGACSIQNEGAPQGSQDAVCFPPNPSISDGDVPPPVPLVTQEEPLDVALQDLSRYKADLTMPTMINLETVGRRRSPRDSTRPNRFGFTSAVTKLFTFSSASAFPKDPIKRFPVHAHTIM